MKERKLTVGEAIELIMADKILLNEYGVVTFFTPQELAKLDLFEFSKQSWYEYKPEKEKNLLERFADWCDVELTYDSGYIYTNIIRTLDSDDVITWLEKQPESRLKAPEKPKSLSERFAEEIEKRVDSWNIVICDYEDVYNWLKQQEGE